LNYDVFEGGLKRLSAFTNIFACTKLNLRSVLGIFQPL